MTKPGRGRASPLAVNQEIAYQFDALAGTLTLAHWLQAFRRPSDRCQISDTVICVLDTARLNRKADDLEVDASRPNCRGRGG
jgi:hypothetical protein